MRKADGHERRGSKTHDGSRAKGWRAGADRSRAPVFEEPADDAFNVDQRRDWPVRHCNYVFRSDYRGVLDRPWDWWSDETMGGGTLGAIGSHVIDSFRWMLNTEISAVSCMLNTHIAERPDKTTGDMRRVTSDDEAKLHFRFADSSLTKNATGAAALSVVESGSYENRLEIYGTTGALMVEETGELWRSPAGSGAWRPVQVHQDPMAPGMRHASWSRGFAAFACDIVEALREGQTVEGAATFEDGYRVQLVLDAARASNTSGCWTSVGGGRSSRQEQ